LNFVGALRIRIASIIVIAFVVIVIAIVIFVVIVVIVVIRILCILFRRLFGRFQSLALCRFLRSAIRIGLQSFLTLTIKFKFLISLTKKREKPSNNKKKKFIERSTHLCSIAVHSSQTTHFNTSLIAIQMKIARTRTRRAAGHGPHLDVVGRQDARAVAKRIEFFVARRLLFGLGRFGSLVAKEFLHVAESTDTHR
jgi:hypothetical protein